ncbi:MAG: TonB-dependent receptor [Tannerella sp.]|jgi:TonB-linked SusC/RagA family outer membrane protein|nr:TonB-dependent receptor [Tannerella sp.]
MFFFVVSFAPLRGTQSANIAVNETQQQTITVTGTVKDSYGEPLAGANVVAGDQTTGTITDADGAFKLNVARGSRLTISYIGYTSQTVTVNGNNLAVILEEDTQMLGEVQVVAYGVQKKATLTGAISGVKGDELLKTPTSSVNNVLSGLVTGLTSVQYSGEPGDDAAQILIRGKATFANSTPLIQIDGVERSSFHDIDPNEIESLTVLKDASATAVFGVKGANGVILITTKRGQEGKAKISFSTSATMQAPTKLIDMANSYEYATFHNTMKDLDGAERRFGDYVIERFRLGDDPIRYPDVDWVDYVMKDLSLETQHNINISGGTKTVKYFVSAGAFTQGGLFDQFDLPYDLTYQYNRYNYRSNLDIDVTKTTKIALNISGNVDNASRPYTGVGSTGLVRNIYQSNPFSSPGLVDGRYVMAGTNYLDVPDQKTDNLPWVAGTGLGYYGGGFMQTSNNTLSIDLALNQKLDVITKGLGMRVKGSYYSAFQAYKNGSAGRATFTPVKMVDGVMTYKKSGENSQLTYSDTRGQVARNWYMEVGFDWARDFGEHHVTALALYNQDKKYYPSTFAEIPTATVGLVGRVTYDWKSRYLAEFNVGYNGSENFAPERRFGFFPAGSLGWIASEEAFWKPLKPVIGHLKLRASMGLVGNDKVGGSRFMYTPDPYNINQTGGLSRAEFAYYFGSNRVTLPSASEKSKNNAFVTWEKATKQNYGIDANFLRDRLKASFDYFTEVRDDILVQDGALPALVAFPTSPYANMGKVESWGWEVSLRWDDRVGKDFRYYVGLNLSYNQNEIIERKETPQNYDWLYQKGHRIGSRKMYQFWRYYDDATPGLYEKTFGTPYPTALGGGELRPGDAVFIDLDGDGTITTEDMTYDLGYTDDPEYLAGINFGFSWKNFDVSTQWTGAWNVSRMLSDVFRRPFTSNNSTEQGGLLKYHVYNSWTEENPSQSARYPRPTWTNTNNYAEMTLYEVDSRYLRLKTLQIAYNFKFPFMAKMKMNACQLAFSGYNLFTFMDFMWGDPEARSSNSPTYPLQKTYSLSLKLGF